MEADSIDRSLLEQSIADFLSERIERHGLEHLVLAYSGGPDSTALLHAMAALTEELEFDLSAVHVNHGLRGKQADKDQKHCEKECKKADVPLEVVQRTPVDGAGETWARRARYEALREAGERLRADAVVTGHHLDDAAETILLKMLRGVRPARMFGMKPVRRLAPGSRLLLLRPLLSFERRQIEEHLSETGHAFVQDASNEDTSIARNRLRHDVIPIFDELAPPGWKRRWVALFAAAAQTADHREREAEHALLVTLLRASGLSPTDGRIRRLRHDLHEGKSPTVLGTKHGVQIRRRGQYLEVVHPREESSGKTRRESRDGGREAQRRTARDGSGVPSRPPGRSERPETRTRTATRSGTQTAQAARPKARPAPPSPGTLVEPGQPVPAAGGSFTYEVVTAAQAEKVIRALRRKRSKTRALLHLPEAKTPPEIRVRTVHEEDRIRTLGFSHVRRVLRAMQSRGISQQKRESATVVLLDGQVGWVVGFEIAHEVRFRTDERKAQGIFLDLQVEDSDLT